MDLELVIARVEAELEAHTRAWAETGAPPPAPAALVDDRVRRVLARGAASDPRARAYLAASRVAVIERDPAVVRARAAAPSWDGLRVLTAARAAAAEGALGAIARAAMGVGDEVPDATAIPAVVAGWRDDRLPAIDERAVARVAGVLADAHGIATGGLSVRLADEARTFVVTPGRDVRVVVRAGASLARWSEALHELGHALVGLAPLVATPRPSRAIDEGIAAWIARHVERAAFVQGVLGGDPDDAVIARAARARAVAQRAALARFEAQLLAGGDPDVPELGVALARPTAALWHEPGAQLAYAAADRIAAALDATLGDAWPTARLQIAEVRA